MDEKIYSVTEFNKMVKGYIEENSNFHEFFLKGELSGVTYYKSGHLYFTLKDSKSQIKCAAFNYAFKRIPDNLKEGDSVKIFGDIGFYETRGDFQVLVRHVQKEDKLGEMFAKLEKLKKDLEKQGMFSPLFKKQLPKYPKAIGVVTAYTGAAFHDIVNTTRKRFENVDIYIYSAKVQGIGAKEEIVKGIKTLNKIPEIDLIVAGRGGGSIEDLWAFNEEEVAKAFFQSEKPIISAVGHEIDNLLSDLVADVRAATPTQAIEIAIPVKKDIEKKLFEKEKQLKDSMSRIIKDKKYELQQLKNNYLLKNFIKTIDDKNQTLIIKEVKLQELIEKNMKNKKHQLEIRTEKIIALNPLGILKRGYSITISDEKIVRNSSEIKVGDKIETVLEKGKIISKVEEIN
ncbi:exodeoxyribonuclease VII large subunit [Candidatus Cetobacterium colombiensis]|uniref:Exodeoxyribonuclease 7 large subunit n=1 Tax=Candidatus Cetobacterium colombiensis TaxID=3073100 RepID=A0ABU4WA28_9FUSO|nr:exodeoxyribonuclease VII large subunit [Candidatus Cetobacterium colombiensis]MDX8336376.1 exodeoxyribonuclease VII large subunit [Candidatus Cetobacterium colombiensis]